MELYRTYIYMYVDLHFYESCPPLAVSCTVKRLGSQSLRIFSHSTFFTFSPGRIFFLVLAATGPSRLPYRKVHHTHTHLAPYSRRLMAVYRTCTASVSIWLFECRGFSSLFDVEQCTIRY